MKVPAALSFDPSQAENLGLGASTIFTRRMSNEICSCFLKSEVHLVCVRGKTNCSDAVDECKPCEASILHWNCSVRNCHTLMRECPFFAEAGITTGTLRQKKCPGWHLCTPKHRSHSQQNECKVSASLSALQLSLPAGRSFRKHHQFCCIVSAFCRSFVRYHRNVGSGRRTTERTDG